MAVNEEERQKFSFDKVLELGLSRIKASSGNKENLSSDNATFENSERLPGFLVIPSIIPKHESAHDEDSNSSNENPVSCTFDEVYCLVLDEDIYFFNLNQVEKGVDVSSMAHESKISIPELKGRIESGTWNETGSCIVLGVRISFNRLFFLLNNFYRILMEIYIFCLEKENFCLLKMFAAWTIR